MSMYMFKKGSDEWLKFRQGYITATEASSLLGVNSYLTANKLLERKKDGKLDKIDNHYMRDGRAGEQLVFALLEEEGWELNPLAPKDSTLVYADPLLGLSSTPDNFRWEQGKPAVLEVKTTKKSNIEGTWDGGVPPLRYLVQVHVQMLTTGIHKGYLVCAVLEPNVPVYVYQISSTNTYELAKLIGEMMKAYRLAEQTELPLRTPKKIREEAVRLLSESATYIGLYRHPDVTESKSVDLDELFT